MSGKAAKSELATPEIYDARQAWSEELERRIISIDNGTAKLIPWEDICARLKRRLQR